RLGLLLLLLLPARRRAATRHLRFHRRVPHPALAADRLMAVTAYVGEPGSGKTYEVVSEVVLPALREGRRVISNIRGLHFDEMKAYLMVECGVAESAIGELLIVAVEEPGKPNFFYTESNTDSVVRPGDLVVLDECWRWFAKGMVIN